MWFRLAWYDGVLGYVQQMLARYGMIDVFQKRHERHETTYTHFISMDNL